MSFLFLMCTEFSLIIMYFELSFSSQKYACDLAAKYHAGTKI